MSMQTIDVGQTANDDTGDPLRVAYSKINQNFSEVYAALNFNAGGLAILTTWMTGVLYLVGQIVAENGNIYRCLVQHGSGVFATDLAAGKWILVAVLPQGNPGLDGRTIYSGNGAPTNDVGANGDYYFDLTAVYFYGPKVGGTWPAGIRLIAPTYGGTSITPLAIGAGPKAFTTQSGLAYQNGARVRASSAADVSNWMEGVAAYSGSTLTITVDKFNGTGTFADWNLNIAGQPGGGALSSGTGLQKGDGSGGLAAATAGTDFMKPDTTSTVSKGFTLTPNNIGTVSSGTVAPDPTLGNYQYYTNNGAHTLAAPSSDCAMSIQITNGASAGSITFSGFTVAAGNTGDSLTTTNTSKFKVFIERVNGVSTYWIKALQ